MAQVPQGTTPRTMVVHLTGELTRTMKPGDPVTVSGIFLPEPFVGFRAAKAGLLTSTFLLAQRVLSDKQSYNAISQDVMHDAAIQVRRVHTTNPGLTSCTGIRSVAS